MSEIPAQRVGSSLGAALVDTVLALYPVAWRARYGDEVRMLMEDSGVDPRGLASLVRHVVPAWVRPAGHLHDRPARMRASLVTVLVAWVVSAGLAAVFVQLTQAQASLQDATAAAHPLIRGCFWVFDAAVMVSVVAVVVGGAPLWWAMARAAAGERRGRDLAYLLCPVVVPVVFLTAAAVVVGLVRRPAGSMVYPGLNTVIDLANGNVGRWWFLTLVAFGFVAAGVSAAGPGLALRRLRPQGRAVRVAVYAAGVAAVSMGLGGVASVVCVVGLYRWAPLEVGYHHGWPLGLYVVVVGLASTTAVISAARGVRAAHLVAGR
jgi:hypothetical protein